MTAPLTPTSAREARILQKIQAAARMWDTLRSTDAEDRKHYSLPRLGDPPPGCCYLDQVYGAELGLRRKEVDRLVEALVAQGRVEIVMPAAYGIALGLADPGATE